MLFYFFYYTWFWKKKCNCLKFFFPIIIKTIILLIPCLFRSGAPLWLTFGVRTGERVKEWKSERVTEWKSERVKEWKDVTDYVGNTTHSSKTLKCIPMKLCMEVKWLNTQLLTEMNFDLRGQIGNLKFGM